jgi:NADP-dependent alcohol dehydrogenase
VLYGGEALKPMALRPSKSSIRRLQLGRIRGNSCNPEYEVLLEALKIIKEKNITYMLAVVVVL